MNTNLHLNVKSNSFKKYILLNLPALIHTMVIAVSSPTQIIFILQSQVAQC